MGKIVFTIFVLLPLVGKPIQIRIRAEELVRCNVICGMACICPFELESSKAGSGASRVEIAHLYVMHSWGKNSCRIYLHHRLHPVIGEQARTIDIQCRTVAANKVEGIASGNWAVDLTGDLGVDIVGPVRGQDCPVLVGWKVYVRNHRYLVRLPGGWLRWKH